MKTLTAARIDSGTHDVILDYYSKVIQDENRKPEWINKDKNIAKHRQRVANVVIYLKDYDDSTKVRRIAVDPETIKRLAAQIAEIEAQESEEEVES